MTGPETFLWGLFGGFGAEMAVLFAIRHQLPADAPHYLKSKLYYLVALVMCLVGGIIALAYSQSGTSLNAILAIQIGASAPLLLRKLSETVVEPPRVPPTARID